MLYPFLLLHNIKSNENSNGKALHTYLMLHLLRFPLHFLPLPIRLRRPNPPLASFFRPHHIASTTDPSTNLQNPTPNEVNLRVPVGILTLPDNHQHRSFLRQVYSVQSRPQGALVDIKFVFCNLTKDDQRFLISLVFLLHDDVIILNCTENMNNGKTFTYFSSLPAMLSNSTIQPPYDFMMKTDDDTYIRLGNLVNSLSPLPREDLYYGFVLPCKNMDPFQNYMSGMGYLVSWDLVKWVSGSEIPRAHVTGHEDLVFGDWIRVGHKAKNRFNAKWSMYNYPPNPCSHELWPNTVGVHFLKTQEKWIRTLRYFNVTANLKPSKLYHLL